MTVYANIFEDQKDFLECLSLFDVSYLIIGGHAVSIHAQPRATKDIDIWIGTDLSNREKVVQALVEFGAPQSIVQGLKSATPNEFIRMGTPPVSIDILQSIPGVDDFKLAIQQKVEVEIDGITVSVIGVEDLIKAKIAAGRKQDLADVEALEKVLEKQK